MSIYKLRNKVIIYFFFIFLLLNLMPITIVTCNKEQDTCKCMQFFMLFGRRKYDLKQIKLSDIKQAVYYKEKFSRNYGILNNIYPGHGVGIELKEQQRVAFYNGQQGDYIIPFYDFISKTKTEKFVNNFNKYISNKNKNDFNDVHISLSLVIFSILLFFLVVI